AKQDYLEALNFFDSLKSKAEKGNVEAQYYLCKYNHHLQNYEEAVRWAICSAEQGYARAKKYLDETNFPTEIYMHIAQHYEIIKNGIPSAIKFYNKGIELKHADSAFCLGLLLYLKQDKREDGIKALTNAAL